jgi:F-type H+-transporting ATPase subunit alpha
LLKQPQYTPLAVEKQVAILYAGTQGLLDQIEVQDVRAYETDFHRFLETRFANLLTTIREKKTLDDDAKTALGAAIKEFNEQFAASRAAGARA